MCDFQELYRYLIDDYLIDRCHTLRKKDFVLITGLLELHKLNKTLANLCFKKTKHTT